MKLRWSNTRNRSLEFDSGSRDGFAERMADAWLDYARPLRPEGDIMVFRRTASGSIGAILGDRNWQSQDIWPDLDAIREAIKSRRLYVPSGTTVEYRIVEDANAYRDQVRAAADAYTRERLAAMESRGHVLRGYLDGWGSRAELHVEAAPDRWQQPIFPPRDDEPPITMPCDLCNGQPTVDGQATFQLARQTHVITSRGALYGGSRHRGDHKQVHPEGYHETPDPTLVGLYWNDWVLKIGPGHWHGDAVYDACVSALQSSNQFTGFIADVTDSLQDERRTNHDTRTAFPHDSRGTRRDGPGLWI